MREVILYFGSFDPIHNGHLAVAEYAIRRFGCEVWLVVSPSNPLKDAALQTCGKHRLAMACLAAESSIEREQIRVCGIEFDLPRPSYTIDTLRKLEALYPENRFSILAGTDIVAQLDRWKEYDTILDRYRLLIYPREDYPVEKFADRIHLMADAPCWRESSTEIRGLLCRGEDIAEMVPVAVNEYIKKNNLWTCTTE